jgi:hypothetical protein
VPPDGATLGARIRTFFLLLFPDMVYRTRSITHNRISQGQYWKFTILYFLVKNAFL